jgi:hypothetical protein
VVAGVVAFAGVAVGVFDAADLLELLLFLAAFFFGCCGESRPWNVWPDAPPAIASARRRAWGRSERNMSTCPP